MLYVASAVPLFVSHVDTLLQIEVALNNLGINFAICIQGKFHRLLCNFRGFVRGWPFC